MIRSSRIQLPLFALAAAAFAGQALAQDSGALLDALVQEGVIKESKAEAIRAKLKKAAPSRSADKIQLDDSIKEIKISGDARFRYQWEEARPQTPPLSNAPLPGDRTQQRERVSLRIGADAKL